MKTKKLLIVAIALFYIAACKKDVPDIGSLTSLTVVNAIVNGTTAKMGSNTLTIGNNNSAKFTMYGGDNQLYIYPATDSLKPYFNSSTAFLSGGVYSLYLFGPVAAHESLLVKESFPKQNESTVGVRFINLSPNSSPLNITIAASPNVNEVSNLSYKYVSEFKTYNPGVSTSYTFQVRKSSDNSIVTTFNLNPIPRSTNITLVIRGLVNSSPSVGVTRVNNDRP